jgi:arylsulfatase A-like enzyme
MKKALFIMCDQLRFDYLSCTGHPHIHTPNIDRLASLGMRFDRSYTQSPICGPSRMSFYTGRYVRSHGSTWNGFPLRVGEMTIGDHLTPLGVRTVLCGKTHMSADIEGIERLGIDPNTEIGNRLAECGFEVWDRLDGLHPTGGKQPSHYQKHLSDQGYDGPNPWEQWANSAEGDDGEILSGWLMEHADKPARIDNENSETPYTTSRAIEFMEQARDESWCLHLSYIKPHWPYIVPEPYHNLYSPDQVIPVVRDICELDDPHPILKAYHQHRFSKVFTRPEVRERVIPAYMGLIKQIDDEIGRLLTYLEESGQIRDTLIVFTSDHGDYLGDHWLGEKELFHDPSVRIPLIVVDPDQASDGTRGQVSDDLVEAIDLLPTFVDYFGGKPRCEILEGNSLLGRMRNAEPSKRQVVISEYDYSMRQARQILDQQINDCRLTMVFDGRFKLVHCEGFRPMLYDLQNDPNELRDLGNNSGYADIQADLEQALSRWARKHHNRTTISECEIAKRAGGEFQRGIKIGFWDEDDLAEAEDAGVSGN